MLQNPKFSMMKFSVPQFSKSESFYHSIEMNYLMADMTLRIPEGYRTLSAVNEMLRRYEDCCEYLCGKDPTTLQQLADFCKLEKRRERSEEIMRQMEMDSKARQRQHQEEAHRERMSGQWRTQSDLNRKTDELNQARKELEELAKELPHK